MKKLILLLVSLMIYSCTSHAPLEKEVATNSVFKSLSKEEYIGDKFKELYNLGLLKRKFPEFKKDIDKRIQNLSLDSKVVLDLSGSRKIINVRQKELTKVSDSVQVATILFDLVSENSIKTDSVFAYIITRRVFIDSNEVLSTKVKFSQKK